MQWVRSSYSSGARSNWGVLFVATIVVCVFVLPSDSTDKPIVMQGTDTTSTGPTSQYSLDFFYYGK